MLEIKKYGEPILRKKSRPIGEVNDEIRNLINFMIQAMYKNHGVGLAANQIGLDLQLIVVDAGEGLKVLINPKITSAQGRKTEEEGCLSFPGVFFRIKRPAVIKVEALDKNGRSIEIKVKDLEARAICHEIDHLNGKLIIDRISAWDKFKYKINLARVK